MQTFMELIKQRHSIRKYTSEPVDIKLIEQCVEAARLAPSACNVQPWRFNVITAAEIKEKIRKKVFSGVYSSMKWVCDAPVIVVIEAVPDFKANVIGRTIQGTKYYLIDIGIAGEHFALQAEELGLSTCWIGWFNRKKLKKILKTGNTPAVMFAVGYTDIDKSVLEYNRKPLKDILVTDYMDI